MNHTKNGGGGRDRTDDLKLAKLPLSQLSYAPDRKMVGLGRLELPTSRLSGVRSNRAELQARMIGPCPAQTYILGNPKNILFRSGKLERDTKTAADISALSIVKV